MRIGLHRLRGEAPDSELLNRAVSGVRPISRPNRAMDTETDVNTIANKFTGLEEELRDVLLMNYVEEMARAAVGVKRVYSFLRFCFLRNQAYRLEPEHDWWT